VVSEVGTNVSEQSSAAIFKATITSEMEGIGSCEMLVSKEETT
jgi:hypothetical protein